jgi:hypothetical protein
LRQWNGDALPQRHGQWLSRMSTWARAQVFDVELMRKLSFEHAKDDVCLQHDGMTVARIGRPELKQFVGQARRVESWAALRSERAPEILAQIAPQFPFWSSIVNISDSYAPYTAELLNVALRLASSVVQWMKFSLVCPRPWDFSPRVQPMIESPGFYAYPSGHGTQAYMVAQLLIHLTNRATLTPNVGSLPAFEEMKVQLWRQAERIATNRVVAGVHFPVDSAAGCALGRSLADYLAHRCTGIAWHERHFTGTAFEGDLDFDDKPLISDKNTTDYYKCLGERRRPSAAPTLASLCDEARSNPLAWLWVQAAREWHEPGRI